MVLEARKIIERLFSRGGQAASGGLLLDEQLALPEKIEKSPLFVRQTDAVLKARDPAAGDAKKLEKFIIESLRLAALVTGVVPFRANFAALALISFQSRRMAYRITESLPILYCEAHEISRNTWSLPRLVSLCRSAAAIATICAAFSSQHMDCRSFFSKF